MKKTIVNQTSFAKTQTPRIGLLAMSGMMLLAACQAPAIQNPGTRLHQPAAQPATTGFKAQAVAEVSSEAPLGANVGIVNDWTRTMPFVDLVKQGRKFGSAAAPWDMSAPLDPQGWPTGDFGVVLMALGQGFAGYGGTYKMSFNGQASVRLGGRGSIRNQSYDAASNTTTAEIALAEDSPGLMLSFTNTHGSVRNLRVLQPGYALDGTQTFTSAFLEQVRRFRLLRLKDLTRTDGDFSRTGPHPAREWADRTPPDAVSYASLTGVPWEVCIQLANELHKDIWISVPHMASDDYVRSLASLMKQRLAPDVKLYVEYSNELWNWAFAQTGWNATQAQSEVAAGGSPLNYDGSTNQGYLAWRRAAKRTKEISDIFRSVYGDEGFGNRFRPVLSAQFGQPETLRQGLNFINAVYGPPENYLYGAAGAPYFGIDRSQDTEGNLTSDQILTQLDQAVDRMAPGSNGEFAQIMEATAALTRYNNLSYMAYEGSPDTGGPNNIAAKRAAALDPQIQGICEKYLNTWYSWGFDNFFWFLAGAGSYNTAQATFHLTANMSVKDTPKLRCMDSILNAPRTELRAGLPLPGSVYARQRVGRRADWQTAERALASGSWPRQADYLLRTPAAGRYRLVLRTQAYTPGSRLPIWVNHRLIANLEIPVGGATVKETAPLELDLGAGMQVVRLQLDGGTNNGYMVQSLNFSQLP